MTNLFRLLERLWLLSLGTLIFLIPSNLFMVLSEQSGYVTGLRVDYLLTKLYLSDLVAWAVIGLGGWLWFQEKFQKQKASNFLAEKIDGVKKTVRASRRLQLLLVTTTLLIISQLFSPHPLISGWFTLQLLEAVLLGWVMLVNRRRLFGNQSSPSSASPWPVRSSYSLVWWALVVTIFFQTTIAITQFWTQSSVWGYAFLGEVALSSPYGIAHTSFGGRDVALAYGTTAHPNVLAGVIVLYSLISWHWLSVWPTEKSQLSKLIGMGILACAPIILFITQSLSALLALAIGSTLLATNFSKSNSSSRRNFLARYLHQVSRAVQKFTFLSVWTPASRPLIWMAIIFTLVPFVISVLASGQPDNLSLVRRAWLNQAAVNIFTQQPLAGTGLNLFTTQIKSSLQNQELVRFVQPAHHLGLLGLAETGLFGIAWLITVIITVRKKLTWYKLQLIGWVLLPIAALDHYLLTLQTGRLLISTFVVLMTLLLITPQIKSSSTKPAR